MSGNKKLARVCRNNRVVAMIGRKKEVIVKDQNGEQVKDKNGEVVVEKIQLYNIYKMR